MSKKTHNISIKMANTYAAEHPEVKDLIDTFVKMSAHPKTMCKIQIGDYSINNTFASKLTSNIRFAATLFTSCENELQVLVRNHSENIIIFNLASIKIYSHEKKSYTSIRKETNEVETFYFHYNGDDYMLKTTFEYYRTYEDKDNLEKIVQDGDYDEMD